MFGLIIHHYFLSLYFPVAITKKITCEFGEIEDINRR
jgi:hypothetical protein